MDALSLCPYLEVNNFSSFALEREDAICKWYIDGKVKKKKFIFEIN